MALVGGTVMTAAGPIYSPGHVVLRAGKIVAVGAGEAVGFAEARRVDAAGMTLTPGLIDVHSHMGVAALPQVSAHDDVNESSRPLTPELRAEDSFWPQDPALTRALQEGGVTVANILPGSANLVGGQSMVIKLRLGRDAAALRFVQAPRAIKMACGENPKSVWGGRGQAPMTRMGNLASLRHGLVEAEAYSERWRRHRRAMARWQAAHPGEPAADADEAPEAPERDLALEALDEVRQGHLLVHVHCYRADDMLAFLRLSSDFGFKLKSFHHALEAYKLRHQLAAAGAGVATWADWWGFKLEAWDGVPQNAAMLTAAGVRTSIHSDSEADVWHLNQEAAKAQAAGAHVGVHIDDDQALRWVTANPAWTLGVDHLTGTLEVGKMGDVVMWQGHPLSVYARPERIFIDGVEVFTRTAAPCPLPLSDFELTSRARACP